MPLLEMGGNAQVHLYMFQDNRIFHEGKYIVQTADPSLFLFPLLVVVIILLESFMSLLMIFEKGRPDEYLCPRKRK